MDTLEDWLAFRAGENLRTLKLTCTECGGKAEGNVSWTDGSGDVCDTCVKKDDEAALDTTAHIINFEDKILPYENVGPQADYTAELLDWDEG